MIIYLDASALVKLYVTEAGSKAVNQVIETADQIGTSLISRAEVAAALAKAVRMGILQQKDGLSTLQTVRKNWSDFVRIPITEIIVSRADSLAWEHHLRGYDAVHLAAALLWQETIGEPITIATFDQSLWEAADGVGLIPFPFDLPVLLKEWKTAKGTSR